MISQDEKKILIGNSHKNFCLNMIHALTTKKQNILKILPISRWKVLKFLQSPGERLLAVILRICRYATGHEEDVRTGISKIDWFMFSSFYNFHINNFFHIRYGTKQTMWFLLQKMGEHQLVKLFFWFFLWNCQQFSIFRAFFVTTNVVITPNQTWGECPEVS